MSKRGEEDIQGARKVCIDVTGHFELGKTGSSWGEEDAWYGEYHVSLHNVTLLGSFR